METALYIYLAINLFIAGYNFSEIEDVSTDKHLLFVIGKTLLLIAAGVIIYIVMFIWIAMESIWDYIESTFQITFWFRYHFTDSVSKLTDDQLRLINIRAKDETKKTVKARIWRYAVKLINKKRNYIFRDLG